MKMNQIGDQYNLGNTTYINSLTSTGNPASGNISGSSFFGDGSTLSGIELSGRGVFSGSEQLPGGLISSSEQLPGGIVSGAAQLLSTFDTRYLNTDGDGVVSCLLYTSPSPRDVEESRMPSSA